jgi:Uncharacterized protein conserved in bacteria
MIEKDLLRNIVEEYLRDKEHYLVDIEIDKSNRIVVEIDHDEAVSIEDCIVLNKHIEANLDREKEDYELEVTSAGISSPFKTFRQYRKNIGNEVEILTKSGKKMTGILKDADEKQITLTIEKQIKPEGAKRKITVNEDLVFPYEDLKYTKYVIRFKK